MRLCLQHVRCLLGRRAALDDVDLALGPGEAVAVLGPNGAGKTTLLRVGAGLLRPASGRVTWDGSPPSPSGRRRIGYVGHRSFLYDNLTARENLLFFAELYGLTDAEPRVRDWLAEEGLRLFSHDPVRSFSRGMQQRLSLCRAWLHRPELMLLDEPWTGLDHEATQRWEARLAALLADGGSALIVLHDPVAACRICDRQLRLQAGRRVEQPVRAGPAAAPAARVLA